MNSKPNPSTETELTAEERMLLDEASSFDELPPALQDTSAVVERCRPRFAPIFRYRLRLAGGIAAALLLVAGGVIGTMVLLLKTTGHVVAPATGPTPPPTNPGPPERAFDPSAVQLDLTSKYGAVLARRRMLLSNDTLDCTVSSFPAGRFRHGCVLKIGPENDKVDPWKLTLDAAEGRFKQANFVVQTGSVPGDLLMVVVLSSTREPHLADLPLYQSVVV